MTPDLVVTSNRAAVTLPGADGAATFNKVWENADSILRRIQSTAFNLPREILISQVDRKPGTRAGSRRTVIQAKERDLTTIVPLESGLGGRADGEAVVTVTIVRPTSPGYQTTFSDAKLKTLVSDAFDVVLQNIAAILAGEK